MEVHPSLEAAIKVLETKHFHRGEYNPQLGSVEWWNEQDDFAIILRNCQGFMIQFAFSAFFTRKLSSRGERRQMSYNNGGDNDNDNSTEPTEPTPGEIAHQENTDEAFEELETIVTENSGEEGRDSDWGK